MKPRSTKSAAAAPPRQPSRMTADEFRAIQTGNPALAKAGKRGPSGEPEHIFSCGVAAFFDAAMPLDVRWSAVPNGGYRAWATANKLRAEGLRPGALDFVCVAPDLGTYWIELKVGYNGTSDDQDRWIAAIRATPNTDVAVCRTMEQVEETLIGWGFVLRTSLAAFAPFSAAILAAQSTTAKRPAKSRAKTSNTKSGNSKPGNSKAGRQP